MEDSVNKNASDKAADNAPEGVMSSDSKNKNECPNCHCDDSKEKTHYKYKIERWLHHIKEVGYLDVLGMMITLTLFFVALRSFDLTRKSIQNQTNSFKVNNSAILAIGDLQSNKLHVGSPHEIFFKVYCLGNVPVHVISERFGFVFDTLHLKDSSLIVSKPNHVNQHVDGYLSSNHEWQVHRIITKSLTKEDSIKFWHGNNTMYVQYKYLNDIQNDTLTYTLMLRFNAEVLPEHISEVLINKNTGYPNHP